MSKNVIVNGKTYEGVSFLELLTTAGATALFKDMDEVAGGLLHTTEIASGTFTVPASTHGNTDFTNASAINVEHGMANTPDFWLVYPKYFFDTMDSNLFMAMYSRVAGRLITDGRRAIEGGSFSYTGTTVVELADATHLHFLAGNHTRYQPTYIDNEGNTGTQEYIWIAWKCAE